MADVQRGFERRKSKRVKVNFIVVFQVHKPLKVLMLLGDKEVNALMLDLSGAGMAISANCDIPPLTTLEIKFTLINVDLDGDDRVRSMKVVGEVRSSVLTEKTDYRLGVCFTRISREDKQVITDFVKMISH